MNVGRGFSPAVPRAASGRLLREHERASQCLGHHGGGTGWRRRSGLMQGVTQWLPTAHGPTPATAGADLPLSPVVRKATHLNERAADRNNER